MELEWCPVLFPNRFRDLPPDVSGPSLVLDLLLNLFAATTAREFA
jgi:hypothetical protein